MTTEVTVQLDEELRVWLKKLAQVYGRARPNERWLAKMIVFKLKDKKKGEDEQEEARLRTKAIRGDAGAIDEEWLDGRGPLAPRTPEQRGYYVK